MHHMVVYDHNFQWTSVLNTTSSSRMELEKLMTMLSLRGLIFGFYMLYPTAICQTKDTVVVHKPTIKMATVMKKVQALECQAVVLVLVAVLTEQDLLPAAVEIDVSSLIAMDKNLIEAVISRVCVELFCLRSFKTGQLCRSGSAHWSQKTMTFHSFHCFSIVWGQG